MHILFSDTSMSDVLKHEFNKTGISFSKLEFENLLCRLTYASENRIILAKL